MGLQILVIDDSMVMRRMIMRSLRQAGLDVGGTSEAENGLQGLEALAGNPFDLVLCDWNMPEMDGLTFIKEARKTYQTPIVMLTTESADAKVVEAMEAGADGYVTKPFTPEKLGEKLGLILDI